MCPFFSAAEMCSSFSLSRIVSTEGVSVVAESCSSGDRPDCESASVSFLLAALDSRAQLQLKYTHYSDVFSILPLL